MMTTFVKKYNFAKFINFIRSIDGDFNNASIEYIDDVINVWMKLDVYKRQVCSIVLHFQIE